MTMLQNRRAVVGQPTPLIDGIEKVTGTAKYTADLPIADALIGRILRSPVSPARRARRRHRRGLRPDLWRLADCDERIPAGARACALSRRAAGGGCGGGCGNGRRGIGFNSL